MSMSRPRSMESSTGSRVKNGTTDYPGAIFSEIFKVLNY